MQAVAPKAGAHRGIVHPPRRISALARSAATGQLSQTLVPAAGQLQWVDEYSKLGDRAASPPLPLPTIKTPQCITLVRHGQSSWNAASIVQGSSDVSVLTRKGLAQAQATAEELAEEHFDQLWHSPLARASKTAQVVWGSRVGPQHCDPVLREIDLYSFQGMEKTDIKRVYPDEHYKWQRVPEEFQLDGHKPVHETWYRASLAWQKVLMSAPGTAGEQGGWNTLVVAHNSINQGLISTALQLPCTFFRRLTQNNAAVSKLQFTPSPIAGEPAEAVLLCLNQSRTSSPLKPSSKVAAKVVLLVAPTDAQQQQACVDFLADTPVRHVVVMPSTRSGDDTHVQQLTAALTARCKTVDGDDPDVITVVDEAGNRSWHTIARAARDDRGCNVVVVLDAQSAAGLTCSAFGLGQMARHKFSFTAGGLTVFDFSGPPVSYLAVARCINRTAHLSSKLTSKAQNAAADMANMATA